MSLSQPCVLQRAAVVDNCHEIVTVIAVAMPSGNAPGVECRVIHSLLLIVFAVQASWFLSRWCSSESEQVLTTYFIAFS